LIIQTVDILLVMWITFCKPASSSTLGVVDYV